MTPLRAARSLAACALLCLLALPAAALEVGEQAPLATLPGLGLPGAPGKLLYVDFWASWCTNCRKSFPWMNELQKKYDASRLQVIGVNLDAESKDAAEFLARVPAEFLIAWDAEGGSARAFGVKGMPTSLLIGPDGRVLFRGLGFDDKAREELERLVAAHAGTAP